MLERSTRGIIDVLDHVLDKGIVIDAWVNVALVGIELVTVEARVIVSSIPTYLKYATVMAHLEPLSKPSHPDRRLRATPDDWRRARVSVREQDTPILRRRVEDRVIEEIQDARARTIRKGRKLKRIARGRVR